MKIAIAQIFCLSGDREGNFRRIENAIQEARSKKAELICFPEMAILGWVNPEAHQLAYPIPGKDANRLCELAKHYKLFICIGLGEKVGDKLFDSVILISDQGELLLKHRKINILSELMHPPYMPGNTVQTIDTPFGKLGLLICADSFDEKVLQQMKNEKPDLLLIPYGWAKEPEGWPAHGLELQITIQHAAQTIGCPIIGTNLVGSIAHGPWKGQVFGGQSLAVNAKGQVLVRCADRSREVSIFDLET